jgi:hypothetical protein
MKSVLTLQSVIPVASEIFNDTHSLLYFIVHKLI